MTRTIISCNNCESSNYSLYAVGRGNRRTSFIEKKHPAVICKECGLIFLNPQHSPKDYATYYSGLNVKAFDEKQILEVMKNPTNTRTEIRDFLLKHIDILEFSGKPKLLDVGCGKGIFLHLMRQEGFDVEGLDPGSAETDFIERELDIRVHNGIFNDHTIPDESYDVVSAMGVVEHVNDPKEFLDVLWKLLKPGGYLLLTTPSVWHMDLRHGPESYFKFVHTYYYSVKTLASLMRQEGFDIVADWIKEPVYTKSFLFGEVSKSGGGAIAIIGKKRAKDEGIEPAGDDVEGLKQALKHAKRKFRLQYSVDRITRYTKAIKNILVDKIRQVIK